MRAADLVELRVLEGPNVYFPRPAVKLTIAVPGWIDLPEERAAAVADRLGATIAGRPGSEQRRRSVARLAARLTRRLATLGGVRLAVRGRAGDTPDRIVVAYPWRRRGAAEALGREVVTLMTTLATSRRRPDRLFEETARRLREVDPGPPPDVPEPEIPVISVTGTNGKTTTVRLLAHIVRTAGLRVAYSSTDGVYRGEDELVEPGDYSGFGGARMALEQRPDIAVLETARGGILLRGIGVLHNDVAVVTNVSADHLGLQGIDTVDQLAEVKAAVTRITRDDGWDVLNADDPRVLAMSRGATGRPWFFSLDPDHPALRDALADGGRAMSVLDGRIVWWEGNDVHSLVRLMDVPMTIAGVSSPNVQNAMGAAAAALAVGLAERAVAGGLRSFELHPERNPGRANLFRLDGRIVVIDYAHNEAGMLGLTELCEGLRRRGRQIWIACCSAGDRTDAIMHAYAYRAARGADHVAIAELPRYLRGREPHEVVDRLRAGAIDGGADPGDLPLYPGELEALSAMTGAAGRGDVVAVTALGMRPEIFEWLRERGAEPLSPAEVRALVRGVRSSKAETA